MPHLHTNPGEHDLTASAFVVRDDFSEPRLLLHSHKLLNVLLQPGGHVELQENPWQAVEHELREEAGYTLNELEILQPKQRLLSLTGIELHPTPVAITTHNFNPEGTHKHTDIAFAFLAHGAPSRAPEEGESKDLRWMSSQQLDRLDTSEIFDNVREIGQYVLKQVYSDWERVKPL